MKFWTLTAVIISLIHSVIASTEGIYGPDDRKDLYQVKNALHLKLAQATAGMILNSQFVPNYQTKTYDLKDVHTLERKENLCTSEKFLDQPVAPSCSGFLVGPDTLITAGHCYNDVKIKPEIFCKGMSWVFDFGLNTANSDPTKGISPKNIYGCKQIVTAITDKYTDYAIIKLDRKVTGREPLKFRQSGVIADSTSLVVIGHPNGLPTKIAGNGKITENKYATVFATNLDTFHGNSGSAVFDAVTGQVEGILIMGKNDYVPSIRSNPGSCKIVNKCNNKAEQCLGGLEPALMSKGEVVLRIQTIASLISKTLAVK